MKHITIRFAALLAIIFLGAFSCEDHTVPAKVAKISTLDFTLQDIGAIARLTFRIQFQELGDSEITEYGVVYADAPKGYLPTVNDTKVVFPLHPDLAVQEHQKEFGFSNGLQVRAYVILANGSIIYGNVKGWKD